MSKEALKLVIPKGSLEQATTDLFKRAGWNISISPRNYFPTVDDDEIIMARLRAQEISRYVEAGTFDAGLTGKDWILENESDVKVIDDLVYSKVSQNPARWVLAVDAESDYRNPEDLAGKRIATELVKFTKKFFSERNIPLRWNSRGGALKPRSKKAWWTRSWTSPRPAAHSERTDCGSFTIFSPRIHS